MRTTLAGSTREYRGRQVVLYFIRALGCRICRRHSSEFARLYPEFQKAGAEVLVVTPGDTQRAAAYARLLGITFPVLADPGKEVYRLYGQDRMALGLLQRSEIFVIDGDGLISFAQVHGLPTALPESDEVLRVVKRAAEQKQAEA